VNAPRWESLQARLAEASANGGDMLVLTFDEIEDLVGPLPPPAAHKQNWWVAKNSPQARAWSSAGWCVDTVGFAARRSHSGGWVDRDLSYVPPASTPGVGQIS
jgi:hypothetical protein